MYCVCKGGGEAEVGEGKSTKWPKYDAICRILNIINVSCNKRARKQALDYESLYFQKNTCDFRVQKLHFEK